MFEFAILFSLQLKFRRQAVMMLEVERFTLLSRDFIHFESALLMSRMELLSLDPSLLRWSEMLLSTVRLLDDEKLELL